MHGKHVGDALAPVGAVHTLSLAAVEIPTGLLGHPADTCMSLSPRTTAQLPVLCVRQFMIACGSRTCFVWSLCST